MNTTHSKMETLLYILLGAASALLAKVVFGHEQYADQAGLFLVVIGIYMLFATASQFTRMMFGMTASGMAFASAIMIAEKNWLAVDLLHYEGTLESWLFLVFSLLIGATCTYPPNWSREKMNYYDRWFYFVMGTIGTIALIEAFGGMKVRVNPYIALIACVIYTAIGLRQRQIFGTAALLVGVATLVTTGVDTLLNPHDSSLMSWWGYTGMFLIVAYLLLWPVRETLVEEDPS